MPTADTRMWAESFGDKMRLCFYPKLLIFFSRWIKDFVVKSETIKVLEKNTDGFNNRSYKKESTDGYNLGAGKAFLSTNSRQKTLKRKFGLSEYLQFRTSRW